MAVGDIITSDGKTLTIEDLRKIAVEVEKLISSNSKDPGEWEEVKSLSGITSLPVLQSLGASYKLVRVAVEILKGVDGHDVEFQVDADRTAIQWRKVSVSGGEPSEWKTLIQLSYLKGDAGETPEFRKGDTGLEWKYKSEEDTSWRSLIAIDDLRWHFTDLTKDQIAELWHELPDDVLTEFQAPALEAAEVANAGADRANAAAEAAEGIVSGIRPDWLSGKESPNYIKNKPEIPTLEAIPDENTLSYVNTDGTTINFRIGDDVRVAEDGEYVFYRLYDLAGGKASWQESGSGTALPGNVYLTGANYYNESVRTIKQGYLSNE